MNTVTRSLTGSLVGAVAMVGAINGAVAGPILGAVSAVINSGGPGFGSITDTLDQSGLSVGYTSGVTDFDSYIGSSPSHTSVFSGFEWFSNSGISSASVTYNLGSSMTLDALALWNEEAAGIGTLDLYHSNDGINFTALAIGLIPTDNPIHPNPYFADVFGFGAVNAQYIRFDMYNCPQQPAQFTSCAIGEVAFRQADIPEPGTLALFGLGALGLAATRRRKIS